MRALLVMLVSSITGGIGWWLGAFVNFWLAFFLSLVGTAFGVYWANRMARHYLG